MRHLPLKWLEICGAPLQKRSSSHLAEMEILHGLIHDFLKVWMQFLRCKKTKRGRQCFKIQQFLMDELVNMIFETDGNDGIQKASKV